MRSAESTTQRNLMAAVAAECVEAAKYEHYARVCEDEGQEAVARLFYELAQNEREHAELFLARVGGGTARSAAQALAEAADGEKFCWAQAYARLAREADLEGDGEVAELFRRVASAERAHEERLARALKSARGGADRGEKPVVCRCVCCGYEVESAAPPSECPLCKKNSFLPFF